jgi:hypothetical protein
MVKVDFVVSMPRVHLPSLWTELVILGPILLSAHPMKERHVLHVVSTVKIHAFFDMIINVEGVDRESRIRDEIVEFRRWEVILEAFFDVFGIRACRVICYVYVHASDVPGLEASGENVVCIYKSL